MKIELPENFCREMKALLGDEYEQYIASFDRPRRLGLRLNTLRWTPGECRQRLPWPTEPVGWVENGFFYDESANPSKDPYYYAGLYYLQEPSAMTPASLLPWVFCMLAEAVLPALLSLTTLPSAMVRIRSACRAIFSSWVTRSSVCLYF